MPTASRKSIFISYSHIDKEWLEKLQVHLKPLIRGSDITSWDDRQIQPSDKWHKEISQALDQACVAVLLVSPDFLASDYVRQVEVPYLIAADSAKLLRILWIPIWSSAVMDTELGLYQALSDPKLPLGGLSEAAQKDALVTIARAIRHYVQRREEPPLHPDALQLLRDLDVNLSGASICATDDSGHVWISNGQELKIVPIKPGQDIEWRVLPNQQWKQHLSRTWQGGLVLSDWEGNLFRFRSDSDSDDILMYKARGDDLPMHLLEIGQDGRLVTAAWNGLIRTWSVDGKPVGRTLSVPNLPLRVLPLLDDSLVVVDQANTIRLYDAAGCETWSWQSDEPIEGIWECSEKRQRSFVVLLGKWRVSKVGPGQMNMEEQRFGEPIEGACMYVGRHEVQNLCVACKGSGLKWLSVSPFGLLKDAGIHGNETVLHLVGVPWTPFSSSNEPVVLGVTIDGRLFMARRNHIVLYREPMGITNLMTDPSGRFLLLFFKDRVGLYRNPAVGPLVFRIDLRNVAGELAVDASNRLVVTLKNSGPVAIHRVRGELYGDDRIDSCRIDESLNPVVQPGEIFTLEFAVRARIAGDAVQLVLKLFPEDEGGQSTSPVEMRFSVVSHPKRGGHDD